MKIPPILLFLLFPLILFGQEKNIDENLLAVAGYDLVSYFSQDNPQQGREAFAVSWKGARYLFASKKNKAIFQKNPEKYLPAYEAGALMRCLKEEKWISILKHITYNRGNSICFIKLIGWILELNGSKTK